MAQTAKSPFEVYYGTDGTPLENGYIYFGEYGQNPESVPVEIYWDESLTIQASQPVRTVNGYASRNGSPSNVYVPSN